jgi:hypothetical protein
MPVRRQELVKAEVTGTFNKRMRLACRWLDARDVKLRCGDRLWWQRLALGIERPMKDETIRMTTILS